MMGRLFLALTIFLVGGSPALADRFYVGADVVTTNIEASEQGLSFHDRPIGLRLHGGYEFTEIFALEGSYVESGEAEDTVTVGGVDERWEAELSGYVLSFVFQTAMTTPNLFTKLGYYNGEVESTGPRGSFENDEDGFAAGLGFRHEILRNIAIRGEVDWLESELDNVWSAGVGVEFSFGN